MIALLMVCMTRYPQTEPHRIRAPTTNVLFFPELRIQVSLCRFVHVDRDLVVTGRLPRQASTKHLKPFSTDPRYVKRVLLESIDKKDCGQSSDLDRFQRFGDDRRFLKMLMASRDDY